MGMSACSSRGAPGESSLEVADGALRGEFIEQIATFDDGTSSSTYFLRVGGNDRDVRELVFAIAPDLLSQTQVKVWGTAGKDGRIVVDRMEEVVSSDTAGQALIGAAPIPATKMAMAIVNTTTGATPNVTADTLTQRLFTNPDSVRNYYVENSFGMHDLTGKVVSATLDYPMATCDTMGLATALRPMVDADVGGPSDVYLWYFGEKVSACAWGGLGGGIDTYYNATSGCTVLVQEPGHSFGLMHSSSLTCHTDGDAGPPVPILDDVQQCIHNEYGNPYDTMGSGCRHFSSYHKVFRTYLSNCNVVEVRGSGTFTIFPIEKACNGIQVLQVPMPKVRPFMNSGGGGTGVRNTQLAYYLVELRSPLGFDGGTKPMKPVVLINASPQFSVLQAGMKRGRGDHIWLLDNNPAATAAHDGTDYGLPPGQTFTDPAGGVSITVLSVTADGANIQVDITGPLLDGGAPGGQSTCMDGTPITGPGPSTCGDDGGVVIPPPIPIDASMPPRDAGGGGAGTTGAGGSDATTGAGGSAGSGGGTTTAGGTQTTGPTTGTAGSTGTGSGKTSGESQGLQGGCACRASGGEGPSGNRAAWGAALALAIAAARRRKRAN
jgi:MYXO-CTERM domain-containing protein